MQHLYNIPYYTNVVVNTLEAKPWEVFIPYATYSVCVSVCYWLLDGKTLAD